jgi:pimeloyl-ACP methyl ester carboxylesterase
MKIITIHGANATPTSFSYIKEKSIGLEFEDITYSSEVPLMTTIDTIAKKLDSIQEPVSIMAHSLGGLIAANLSLMVPDKINKICSISSPFGGSAVASVLRWTMPCQLFEDIHPGARAVSKIRGKKMNNPFLSIITTAPGGGIDPGDGVVSISSQKNIAGVVFSHIHLNHFEVLLSLEIVESIGKFFSTTG